MSGVFQILPGTGRWRAKRDGGGGPRATRDRQPPSTDFQPVPLPVNGEDL